MTVEAVLREDRHGLDFVARVPRGIPKHEWSLMLGDALHNFRSAYYTPAWGMVHFNDAQPTKPKAIYFPIMQPFSYVLPGMPSVLRMIHDLDIQDKHKDFLTVSADMNGLALDGPVWVGGEGLLAL